MGVPDRAGAGCASRVPTGGIGSSPHEREGITVLGKSPSWQDADGACSGYLIEEHDYRLLIDCGNGVFAKLRKFLDYWRSTRSSSPTCTRTTSSTSSRLLRADLRAAPAAGPGRPLAGHGASGASAAARAAGARDTFRRVVGAWGNEDLIENAFRLTEYDPADPLEVGRSRCVPARAALRPDLAVEVSLAGGGRFVFGADSRRRDELVEFARGADLLLIEATLPRPERDGVRGHLTPARRASTAAARARAGW